MKESNKDTFHVRYRFILSQEMQEIFDLEFNSQSIELLANHSKDLPSWTNLDFHQCSNCPLDIGSTPHCPLSANLVDLVARFDKVLSYDKLYIDVITKERRIYQETTAQKGISAMMGLIIATSGCPHTVFFKPMARFHLPLASEKETLYRAISMYLLAQYFQKKEGINTDSEFDGLKKIYDNIQIVNSETAERLKAASKTDSSVNAIIRLDLYAKIIPYFIEESLEEIKYLFKPYFETDFH